MGEVFVVLMHMYQKYESFHESIAHLQINKLFDTSKVCFHNTTPNKKTMNQSSIQV
jgi:mitochondrial fission protein ELM1